MAFSRRSWSSSTSGRRREGAWVSVGKWRWTSREVHFLQRLAGPPPSGSSPPGGPQLQCRAGAPLRSVLGIVQGLTEFLPVSSTAHLRIVPALAGWDDPGAAFTAVTQLGTMAAVLLFFRADLMRIAEAWLGSLRAPERRREHDARLGWYIVLGTIPIAIFGLAFKDRSRTAPATST